MQYHVLSLLQAGHVVTFVGYTGEPLVPPLLKFIPESSLLGMGSDTGVPTVEANAQRPTLRVIRFPAPKVFVLLSTILLPIYFAWRAISLFILLIIALSFVNPLPLPSSSREKVKPHAILMQNPPAIPVLAIMVLYKYWTGAKLIIDWHNLYVLRYE